MIISNVGCYMERMLNFLILACYDRLLKRGYKNGQSA